MDRPDDPAPYKDPYGLFAALLYVEYVGTDLGKGVHRNLLIRTWSDS